MQTNKVGLRLSDAPLAEPQCEALFELFAGPLGVVELGRLLKGNDAGRVVLLRKLVGAPSPDLASATDLARSLAHPKLSKVLGIIRGKDAWYVASEYIPGVSLFELGRTVAERGVALDTAVALRIVLDTLKAAQEAQRLLSVTANLHAVRSVYAESVWIARYGEVFVSEVLIASLLADELSERGAQSGADLASPAVDDVASALSELARLLGVDSSSERTPVDAATLVPGLGKILVRFRNAAASELSLAGLITALTELGSVHIASEQQVAAELDRVVGLVLERRGQKIEMLERGSLHAPADDDATRYFRVAPAPAERETTRPPPDPNRGPPSGDPSTDLTAVFRSLVPQPPQQVGDEPTEPPPTSTDVDQPPADEDDDGNPISDVWRQARALLDTKAQRAKLHGKLRSIRVSRRSQKRSVAAPEAGPVAVTEAVPSRLPKLVFVVIAVVALALLVRALWGAHGH
ncbi:MAG: hypothetical protein ABUL62_34820 [Myxococcales bacterium]